MIGQNVLLSLWEKAMLTLAHMASSWRYGRGFVQACTLKHGGDLSAAHRLVSFKSNKLPILIQHGVDTCRGVCAQKCIDHDGAVDLAEPEKPLVSQKGKEMASVVQTSALCVNSPGTRHTSDCLMEITSQKHTVTDNEYVLLKLWLSRSHHLLLGPRERGTFPEGSITEEEITAKLQKWHEDNTGAINGLVQLLQELREISRAAKDTRACSKYALVFEGGMDDGSLHLYDRPDGIAKRFSLDDQPSDPLSSPMISLCLCTAGCRPTELVRFAVSTPRVRVSGRMSCRRVESSEISIAAGARGDLVARYWPRRVFRVSRISKYDKVDVEFGEGDS
nr:hypothetical protein CFP56_33417 [Quercus suber]